MEKKDKKYSYVWYWVCVDLCNGGIRSREYDNKKYAMSCKPSSGLWRLCKRRVSI